MTKYERVELVGGPQDGQRVAIVAGRDVPLVPKPSDPSDYRLDVSPTLVVGTYRRRLGVLEWQGWDE